MTIQQALKKYFGYDSFRGGQQELISASLSGCDVLGIMPTGAGKSICFQLPAILQEGITLVVSPLISLMKDQVDALNQSGIPAAYLNSTLSPRQMETALYHAKNGKYKLVYVAPERLLSPEFLAFAQSVKIEMLTVDEAHCISQWGQDFRPSYAQIPQFIDQLAQRPRVSAFTATATLRVREDIVSLLSLQDPTVLVTGFDRPNLSFEVQAPKNKMQALTSFLHIHQSQSGIVYCATRKTVEEVCEELNRQGVSASRYHAGLTDEERRTNQDDFLFDRVQIMVATNAFGMGIDKSNVAFVVHYNMPKDIESYYQEAGRAGRDGSEATCLLLYSGQDVRTSQWMIEHSKDASYPDAETEKQLKERDYQRLREMTFYATTNDCLRAFILRYFGENPPGYCGHCSNCNTKFQTVDVTEDSQKILSCVARVKERFGASLVIDVLRGSKSERIRDLKFDALSTYGISKKSVHTLRAVIEFLVQSGYLEKSDGQYAVLRLTPEAKNVLNGTVALEMKLAEEKPAAPEEGSDETAYSKNTVPPGTESLFIRLKELRHELAAEQGVPAFVVFSDSSLVDMCVRLPRAPAQFLMVSGVGETKLQRYGEKFLQVIADYCRVNAGLELPEENDRPTIKRKRKGTAFAEVILPDSEICKEVEIFENPIPISFLAAAANEVLSQHACSTVSAVKIADWLVSEGYLQIVEQKDSRAKVPTQKGISLGILQEERTHSNRNYWMNLYPSSAQQFIIDHICDILVYDKKGLNGGH
ncbi:DNA helicase RecQ [Faecalispora anaeroviscerum]|uniref:DNA helicase RecQ n=1 Tax=Faecalispora anaeroviscerum TaxID=2991836 RepID=UPI0024B8D1AE|nr:DNA helicase RecQ [Faecalispora anaeroviscerum]